MNPPRRGPWWSVLKLVLTVAILAAVGWQFWHDLSDKSVQAITVQPEWLAASALLYLVGLAFCAWYWYRLLRIFGERPALVPALRAYYLSQLGKYLPGKAWALMMRGTLVQGPDVKLGVALIATFYEVLTMMASGALVAAVLFVVEPPALLGDTWNPAVVGVSLLAVCGVPLLPGVFNRVVGRLAGRFQSVESFRLPRLRVATLLEGLATTAWVWLFFGLSLWAMVRAVVPEPPPLTWGLFARLSASLALAYVGGFVLIVPGGLGVREWVLDRFLAPELAGVSAAAPAAVVVVLLLRLAWTAGEAVLAAVLWWLPGPRRAQV
jgi:uncharacterized membrane protein YbhN (UPF0104 family)